MSRSVNKFQSEILLNKMQANMSIACGFTKESKETVVEFWNEIVKELNSVGPPVKNVTEWKKVWSDQKRYVRSKAATNLKHQRGTGGGPNQTKYMTAAEQTIYELIGMKESVEGVENSRVFGLPSSFSENDKENEPPSQSRSIDEIVAEILNDPSPSSKQLTKPPPQEIVDNEESSFSNGKRSSLKRKNIETPEKLSTAEMVAKLKTQEKLCSKICDIVESTQVHNKEMESMIKRVYRALEKSNELKSRKLKEIERHHAVCEKLRQEEVKSKIEKNQKLIEIEEMKLALMQKSTCKK